MFDRQSGLASGAAALTAAATLSGCAFRDHRDELEVLFRQGRFAEAAQVMDDPATRRLYGERNQLLWDLDRGALAVSLHDHESAVRILGDAERYMELRRDPTAGDAVAQWLVNDQAAAYLGEPYEDIYVNVFKLLAQLERGVVQGGATVEARRLANKSDWLRARYLAWVDVLRNQDNAAVNAAIASGGPSASLAQANPQGEFVESPLGTFLTAVTFMHTGEPENQRVAARRLESALRLQAGLVGEVTPESFSNLGERGAREDDLLVVALAGRGPTKRSESFGPIPIFDWPLYLSLPVVEPGFVRTSGVRVVAEGASLTEARVQPLPLVEDLGQVAMENHRRQLPLIYARAVLRSSLKAGLSFAGTQAVRQSTENEWAAVGAVIAGLAFVALTEQADTRAWIFLPRAAYAGIVQVPPGAARVRVEFLGPGGTVLHSSGWREVDTGRGLAAVVEQFWE